MSRFLVTTLRTLAFDPAMVDTHYAFLDGLRKQDRIELAGPFAERSGGAYLLKADSVNEATETANRDPLHRSSSSLVAVHEWVAK